MCEEKGWEKVGSLWGTLDPSRHRQVPQLTLESSGEEGWKGPVNEVPFVPCHAA